MASFDSHFSFKTTIGSLGGVAVFLSNPNLYIYAFITLPAIAIIYFELKNRKSKVLLLSCYAATSLYGFIIGRYFFDGQQLTNFGLFAILLALVTSFILAFSLLNIESKTEA